MIDVRSEYYYSDNNIIYLNFYKCAYPKTGPFNNNVTLALQLGYVDLVKKCDEKNVVERGSSRDA